MALIRAQVRLPWTSGVPQDVTVNTFHFTTVDPFTGTIGGEIGAALFAFYNELAGLFSSLVVGDGFIKMYDLADPEPRTPVHEDSFAISVGDDTMPPEVALVVSFQALPESGTPQARRRNRVYLGPFDQSVDLTTGRPSTTLRTAAIAAGQSLLDDSNGSASWSWATYGPTFNELGIVDNGWVDNEWDTQRRRGREATERGTFTT